MFFVGSSVNVLICSNAGEDYGLLCSAQNSGGNNHVPVLRAILFSMMRREQMSNNGGEGYVLHKIHATGVSGGMAAEVTVAGGTV